MPDFTPTQYEAQEGRDGYIARPKNNGKFEVFRVTRGEEQTRVGVADDLAEATALKDQDHLERTTAPAVYLLKENGSGRWVLRSWVFVKFMDPEQLADRFDTEAEALASIPGAVLLREDDGGARVYSSAPATVGR